MNETPVEYIARLVALTGDSDPLTILSTSGRRLQALVADYPPDICARPPAPGRWSINQIAAHLADAELVGGYRIRMILGTNGARLQAFDQDRWDAVLDYQSCDARESAQLFSAYRAGTLRALRLADRKALAHHGLHEERGAETIPHLLRLYAGHDLNHLQQIERMIEPAAGRAPFVPADLKPVVPLDVLEQIDLRVGTIVAVEDVPDSRRLMRLRVDFGAGERVVIAGIKQERADPRAIAGRQALFYCNVPPRRIAGQVSEAMLCDAGYADGRTPLLLIPEWPVPGGLRAG